MAIDNNDDIIDSRDVESGLKDLLDSLKDDYGEYCKDHNEDEQPMSFTSWLEANEEMEADDYRALLALAEEGRGYGDWQHGETLIRRSYWVEYAQQLAEDLDCIKPDARWPNDCIDWEKAARELEVDYTSIDFNGVEYLMRA